MKTAPTNIFQNVMGVINKVENENKEICQSDGKSVRLWNGGEWYEIEFTRIDSHAKIIEWISHLIQKKWVKRNHISLLLAHTFTRFPYLAPPNETGA
jgi:muconolactone delta-isomerase